MTAEQEQEFMELGAKYFNGMKTSWSGTDLEHIYRMWNNYSGETKRDTGCPSCRRETIRLVKDAYLHLKKTKDNNVQTR